MRSWLRSWLGGSGQIPECAGLERRVEDLLVLVRKMAAELAALKDLTGRELDVHIDRVCIEKVHLEKLEFNIDGIGVKDLSGSLSIGVNYGGKVIRLVSPPPGEEAPPPPPAKEAPPPVAPAPDGFSYRTYKV
ncbi:MAG: hypothetical protein AB1776_06680 [Bacillota bacterium]